MELSSMMAAQVSQLQQTVSLGVMQLAQATQAAQATVMLNDFAKAQASVQAAPHPSLGKVLDVSV